MIKIKENIVEKVPQKVEKKHTSYDKNNWKFYSKA